MKKSTNGEENPNSVVSSEAYKTFNASLSEFHAMVLLIMPTELNRALKATKSRVTAIEKKGPTVASMESMIRKLSDLADAAQEYLKGRTLLQDWLAVVLTTMVGAYLEDGLISIATKNPKVLKDASAVGNDRILDASSIEDLRAELRRKWANQILSGGPREWLNRLRKLGVPEYKNACDFRLQHLWDTRNLIVHNRGIATADYLKTRRWGAYTVGDRIHVSTALMKWWLQGVEDFINPVDLVFLKYRVQKGSLGTGGDPRPV